MKNKSCISIVAVALLYTLGGQFAQGQVNENGAARILDYDELMKLRDQLYTLV
jgi:hypothetical protein